MSGPIIRRYGFPNFEKIFGERPIEHGAEETATSDARPDKKAPDVARPTVPPKPADVPDEARRT